MTDFAERLNIESANLARQESVEDIKSKAKEEKKAIKDEENALKKKIKQEKKQKTESPSQTVGVPSALEMTQ